MSDMKCPFCQQKLEGFSVENRPVFACCNLNCKGYFMNAPKELWQELIRTCKALDVAKDTLCWYDDNYDSVVARNTLDEIKTITVPEEKDVK